MNNTTGPSSQRPLKYCEDLPQLNFRRYVDAYLLDAKAIALCQKAKISGTQLSLFRSGRGGMEWHSFIRMMIGMGLKVTDAQGNIILGNPEKFDQEIADNTLILEPEVAEPFEPNNPADTGTINNNNTTGTELSDQEQK